MIKSKHPKFDRYGYQIMAADAIGSSGNLLFSPDISVNHRIILIQDNYIMYIPIIMYLCCTIRFIRFIFWGCDNRNYFVG